MKYVELFFSAITLLCGCANGTRNAQHGLDAAPADSDSETASDAQDSEPPDTSGTDDSDTDSETLAGGFSYTAKPMTAAYVGHAMTLLADGNVLIASGSQDEDGLGGTTYAELFDPAKGTFSRTTGRMTYARANATQTLLPGGEVLLTGGVSDYEMSLSNAEIFDPQTQTFKETPEMTVYRAEHAAVLLPSGKVLIIGGTDDSYYLTSTEYYDPKTKTFVPCPAELNVARGNAAVVLLDPNRVLVIGGGTGSLEGGPDEPWRPVASAEIFDIAAEEFTLLPYEMSSPREYHTATLLESGQVLVTGGIKAQAQQLDTAEVFDPLTLSFRSTQNMAYQRTLHTATLLASGRVLITGSNDGEPPVPSEIFDPTATPLRFIEDAVPGQSRWSHSAILLDNDRVLLTGGLTWKDEQGTGVGGPSHTAELFEE